MQKKYILIFVCWLLTKHLSIARKKLLCPTQRGCIVSFTSVRTSMIVDEIKDVAVVERTEYAERWQQIVVTRNDRRESLSVVGSC